MSVGLFADFGEERQRIRDTAVQTWYNSTMEPELEKTGTHAVKPGALSSVKGENEMILPRDSRFKVTGDRRLAGAGPGLQAGDSQCSNVHGS